MDAKKCDICGNFYLPYNTQCDADDMNDANRISFFNDDTGFYQGLDVCPCCMNKFLELFYDIKKRYEGSDTLCTTSKEELSKRIIPKTCLMCLHRDSLPNEDPCKSCEDFSNFTFKGCV